MSDSKKPKGLRGWHGRGYLPHFDAGSTYPQFVTFRLADSVPAHVIETWQEELRMKPEPERQKELTRLLELFLDQGRGECLLRIPAVASAVEGALLHFHDVRYSLHAWVVMPNHVHTLFTPKSGRSLSDIIGSWKSFTAKEANKILGRTGRFWQEDYFDRYVRNEHHFREVWRYIERNPVSACLVAEPEHWTYGSARRRKDREEAAGTAAVHGTAS